MEVPSALPWVSFEPLLEDLGPLPERYLRFIKWAVIGGESGADEDRRDCGVAAIANLAAQLSAAGVPVFVKQDCAYRDGQRGRLSAEMWALKRFPVRRDLPQQGGLFEA